MTDEPKQRKPARDSRNERLAAALRENLRRRKSQARERASDAGSTDGGPAPDPEPERE